MRKAGCSGDRRVRALVIAAGRSHLQGPESPPRHPHPKVKPSWALGLFVHGIIWKQELEILPVGSGGCHADPAPWMPLSQSVQSVPSLLPRRPAGAHDPFCGPTWNPALSIHLENLPLFSLWNECLTTQSAEFLKDFKGPLSSFVGKHHLKCIHVFGTWNMLTSR